MANIFYEDIRYYILVDGEEKFFTNDLIRLYEEAIIIINNIDINGYTRIQLYDYFEDSMISDYILEEGHNKKLNPYG